MDIYATVTVEELDEAGRIWRRHTSHMVRANVGTSVAAIKAGYNMNRTRIKVDGQLLASVDRR